MTRPPEDDPAAGGFLGRWARRKRETQREAAAQPTPIEGEARVAPKDDLPLPSLDDILPGSDVSAFLQAHVPEALRNAALRKVWSTDPEISGFIEMADYQWDFNNPDSIPGWSSSIKGYDAKALIEQVFGSEEPRVEAPAIPATTPAPPESDAGEDAPAKANIAEMPRPGSISGMADAAPDDNLSIDVAVHNNASDSIAYEPIKRRHGGALPT